MKSLLYILSTIVAAIVSSCAHTNTGKPEECDPNRLALYQSALEYALTDSAVVAMWDDVYKSRDYYVLDSDHTILRGRASDRSLFGLFYGIELNHRDSGHVKLRKSLPLREPDSPIKEGYLPDACLEQMHVLQDSAKRIDVEFHNYNDSILIVSVTDNQRFIEKVQREKGGIISYFMPASGEFLFLHDGKSIQRAYSHWNCNPVNLMMSPIIISSD